MNKDEFLKKFKDTIECESEITQDTVLSDIEEWDSLAIISTIAYLDSIGKKVSSDKLQNIKTVSELIELAGINE